MLSGCFGDAIKIGDSSDSEHWLPPVEERENLVYDNSDVFSRVSWNGTYGIDIVRSIYVSCLLYTSPSPRDVEESRMPSSA